MKRFFSIILTIAALAGATSWPVPANEFREGQSILTLSSDGGAGVQAILSLSRDPPTQQDSTGWRWGSEERAPRNWLDRIEIYRGGAKVFVPRSAFSDLGNPRFASIRGVPGGFRVEIQGGDAATSYMAELVFEGDLIARRRVRHGEFPDEAWEETVYSFPVGSR
jgi:hypothetical protein